MKIRYINLQNLEYCFSLEKTSQNCQSVSKVWVMGWLNFCLKVTKRYKLKKKYCLVLKKMSKNCHSVQCEGVKELSQKYRLWGV